MERKDLAERIRQIGFSCMNCGECCTGGTGDDNLVMVYPAEIEQICRSTGLDPGDFSRPYPESLPRSGGGSITFEWCLKRNRGGCIFHGGMRCSAYASRPWICRTYPFMLSGERLCTAPCKGIGGALSESGAEKIAGLLIARRNAEQEEEERVRRVLSCQPLPPGKNIHLDGTGIRVPP